MRRAGRCPGPPHALLDRPSFGGRRPEDTVQRYRADVSEQDLLSAFDNAPVGMAVLTPSGVVTACNAAMGRLLDRRARRAGRRDVLRRHARRRPRGSQARVRAHAGRGCADRAPRVPVRPARWPDHLGVGEHVAGARDPRPAGASDHAHRGRQRPQAPRGRAQPSRAARPADRPREPDPARRAPAGVARPPRPPHPVGAPVLPRPRRVQVGERPVRARRRRRGAHPARGPDRRAAARR